MITRIKASWIIIIGVITLLLTSCVSREKTVYYQDIDTTLLTEVNNTNYETRLKPDDLLMITVSAEDIESASPFNLVNTMTTNPLNPAGSGQMQQQLYLVDNKGNIEFPVLGTVKIGGLTKEEAIKTLSTQIKQYIHNPIINLRIVNFKITVQGEVVRPGVHTISSERITLNEAIALSGEMTPYSKRDNVLVIREVDGKRIPIRVDMTKADYMNSPVYYLSQNDVVYIEPNKTKINSGATGPNLSLALSAVSVLVTVIALLIK